MIDRFSQVISVVFHPLLMPTLTFGLFYIFAPEMVRPLSVAVLPFLFFSTFVVPALSISALRFLGSIESLHMRSRKERIMPFCFISLFYIMTSYTFIFRIGVNSTVSLVLYSTCILLVAITIITLWFKISVHAAGLSGVVGFLTALLVQDPASQLAIPSLVVMVLLGAIMSARLKLNAHTPIEVWAGAALGWIICFIPLLLWR